MHLTDAEGAELERLGFLPPPAAAAPPSPKPSKYRNQKTTIGDLTFASKREANRYLELRLLEQAGKIGNLVLQPVYVLSVNGKPVGKYIGDFKYLDVSSEEMIVEDVKGVKTAVYKLKKKLMLAIYGVEIKEI